MTCVLFPFRTPERPTLSTETPSQSDAESQDAAERTARHLCMCQELADLGMQLARAAAARALRDAEAASAALPPESPRHQGPDPTLTFIRISREIRQAIDLENRLAAGPAASAPRIRPSIRHKDFEETDPNPYKPKSLLERLATPDNGRAILQTVVEDLTEQHPARDELRGEFATRIERALAADDEYEIPAGAILIDIADDLGFVLDGSVVSQAIYDELMPEEFRNKDREPEPKPHQPGFIPPVAERGTGPPRMRA